MERIQKVIANRGFCSRRKAEEYIKAKKVYVNDTLVTTLGLKVEEDADIVIDGHHLDEKEEKEYYLFYKPSKVVTTVKDEHNRKTVLDYIDTTKRIYPVGRLDYDTSGLLLLTNDGDLTKILTHPSYHVEKLYLAKIEGILTKDDIIMLKKGIVIEGRKVNLTRLKVKKINKEKNTSYVYIGIMEGRNHIIKKIFEYLHKPVLKLKRETFAFLTLDNLKPGEYRKLTIKEVKKLYALKNK